MLNFDTLEKEILTVMFNYKKAYNNIEFGLYYDSLNENDQIKTQNIINKMISNGYIQKGNEGYIITEFGIGVHLLGHNTAKSLVNKYNKKAIV